MNRRKLITLVMLVGIVVLGAMVGVATTTVPSAWIDKYYPGTTDYEARAAQSAANPKYTVADCYVAGLDPTNAASEFTSSFAISNGMVYVSWEPNLNEATTSRIYTIRGRGTMDYGEWTTPIETWHRFFHVEVALPTGAEGETTDVANKGFVPTVKLGVQLWKDGPYWAECNVGATRPEKFGYYFWWGDTVGYMPVGGTLDSNIYGYTGITWKSSTGATADDTLFGVSRVDPCPTDGLSITKLKQQGYIDSTTNLVAKYDAATAHLGAPWRMPRREEINNLIKNCRISITTKNNVVGRLITGKDDYAANSIFIPCAGYGCYKNLQYVGFDSEYAMFWSSMPVYNDSEDAVIFFSSYTKTMNGSHYRSTGLPVRAVHD